MQTGYESPHRGVLILVLGILGLIMCQIFSPFAWIMGKGDMEKIDAGHMDPEGRGMTQAGMICGIVGTVLLVLGLLGLVVGLLFFIVAAGTSVH